MRLVVLLYLAVACSCSAGRVDNSAAGDPPPAGDPDTNGDVTAGDQTSAGDPSFGDGNADLTAPTVPTGLTGVPLTATQAQLSWSPSTDDTGVSGYRLFRDGASVGTTSVTSYINGGLSPETTYSFAVAAFDAAGNESAASTAVQVTTPAASGTSALSTAAAGMAPGDWLELTTLDFDDGGILTTLGDGSILEYNNEANWDPIGRRLFVIGTARGSSASYGRDLNQKWVQYAEASNTWTELPNPEHYIGFHSYDHAAIDTTNGDYFVRTVGSTGVWRYRNSWEQIADLPISYASCCNSLEYFPDMGNLVFVRGSEDGNSEIFKYETNDSWTRLAESTDMPMGSFHDFLEYSPVHALLYFGGGTQYEVRDWDTLYALDASGDVTALPNAPFDFNLSGTLAVAEPVSGNLLLMREGESTIHELSYTNQTWHTRTAEMSIWGNRGTVGTAIPEYGVVVFLRHSFSDSAVILYKHDPL